MTLGFYFFNSTCQIQNQFAQTYWVALKQLAFNAAPSLGLCTQ